MITEKHMAQEWMTSQRAAMSAPEYEDVEREFIYEREAFELLCTHWFSAGPQPEEVVQRVFHAALDRRPDLLRGMTVRDMAMASEESARGRRWRLKALFEGCGAHWRDRYRMIVSTLAVAYDDAGRPEIPCLTLNEALCIGPDGTEPDEATETLSRLLEISFAKGPCVRSVAQLTFTLSGWLFRDRQLNMSLELLGDLFDETRAAQSWRAKEVIGELLRRAGCRGFKAPWQKTETAVEAYQSAQMGNTNRANGAKAMAGRRCFPTIKRGEAAA